MRLHNYWWLLLWPVLFVMLKRFLNSQRESRYNNTERILRWTPVEACILAAPYIVWAGWRKGFGDTEVYRSTFLAMPSSFRQIGSYMKGVTKGPGFRLFELLFRCFISKSDIAFFTLVAIIQMGVLIYIYIKYSPNYWLSMFLFVASTDYLSWMHNGMRQFLAASCMFLCVPLIAKRRYLLAIIIVLIVIPIHSTAIIFLPFIFIVNGKAWNMRTLLFLFIMMVAIVYVDHTTGLIANALEDTVYEKNIVLLVNDSGTNILRALFCSIPAIMSLIFLPYLNYVDDPLINVCANLSIVTAGFYIFSVFSSGILMGAVPIYFSLSNYILIPWLIREVFNEESAMAIEAIFILVYTLFFYYQCGPTWGIL